MSVDPTPKNCHVSVRDFSMIRRATRPTPTQRQWRKMEQKRRSRFATPIIGLLLISVAIHLAIALQVVLQDLRRAVPSETAQGATVPRSGNAWGGATSDTMTVSDAVVGRVTHVRDGDTIEFSGRPIRFAKLDCAAIGTPPGRRADQGMRRRVPIGRGRSSSRGRPDQSDSVLRFA